MSNQDSPNSSFVIATNADLPSRKFTIEEHLLAFEDTTEWVVAQAMLFSKSCPAIGCCLFLRQGYEHKPGCVQGR